MCWRVRLRFELTQQTSGWQGLDPMPDEVAIVAPKRQFQTKCQGQGVSIIGIAHPYGCLGGPELIGVVAERVCDDG